MPTDIDSLFSLIASIDEEEIQREVDHLRAEQERIGQELGKRLDILELLQRQQNYDAHRGRLGQDREVIERMRQRPNPLAGLNGTDTEPPRGVEAVRQIMREGGIWSAPALVKELEKRGWIAPDVQHPVKATETAVSRLHKKYDEVERVGRGKYRYKGAPDPNLLTPGGGP